MKKSMTKTDMNKVNGGTPHYNDWGGKLTSLRRSNRRQVSVHTGLEVLPRHRESIYVDELHLGFDISRQSGVL